MYILKLSAKARGLLQDLFIQEKSSAKLERPGQHRNFGALKPWSEILEQIEPSRKLLFLIRHGEAMHNVIQAYVGEEEWTKVTEGCSWKNESSGETFQLFDPPLTENGVAQVRCLLISSNIKSRCVQLIDRTLILEQSYILSVIAPLQHASKAIKSRSDSMQNWHSQGSSCPQNITISWDFELRASMTRPQFCR